MVAAERVVQAAFPKYRAGQTDMVSRKEQLKHNAQAEKNRQKLRKRIASEKKKGRKLQVTSMAGGRSISGRGTKFKFVKATKKAVARKGTKGGRSKGKGGGGGGT